MDMDFFKQGKRLAISLIKEEGFRQKPLAANKRLLSCEVWSERNARAFCNTAVPSMVIINNMECF